MRRLALLLLFAAPALHAASDADRQLATSLVAITEKRIPEALDTVDQLTRLHPNFRLAQLVKGDLLLARVQPLQTLGNAQHPRNAELEQLREEARQRVRALTDPLPQDKVPAYLLNLDEGYRHALVVDASRSRLYVYANRNGTPIRVADFYVTIGKAGAGKQREGDNRTPIGIYSVSSFKSPRELSDFYGSGAFTLTYPTNGTPARAATAMASGSTAVPATPTAAPPAPAKAAWSSPTTISRASASTSKPARRRSSSPSRWNGSRSTNSARAAATSRRRSTAGARTGKAATRIA